MKTKERTYLQVLSLPFHFQLSLLPSCFCPFVSNTFFQHFLLFKQKKRKKKPQKRKKNAKKGGSLPSSFHFAFSLLTPAFALLFLPFRFKRFLLGIFFFSSKRRKRKHTKKKNHRKEKKMQRKEGAYLSSLASAFGMKCSSCFFLSTFLQR